MPREILKLAPNVPCEMALEYATGKPVAGNYGDQMMFSLIGGKIIYLDLLPAAMIASLAPRVGEPFIVMKKSTGRKGFAPEWDVYLKTERAESRLEQDLRDSIMHAEARKAVSSQGVSAPRGTGTYGPVAVATPFEANVEERKLALQNSQGLPEWGVSLLAKTNELCGVYAQACKYAEGIGVPAAVVRTVMLSAYIGMQKGGQRQ